MIHTVLGPLPCDEMGTTLPHEHIACFAPGMKQSFGDNWFKTDELITTAADFLKTVREQHTIRTVIDATPNDLGRDINILREVSRRSGVHIVASSGMYYGEVPFLREKTPEVFSKYFIHECQNGIAGTDVKPGMLKCATGPAGFTAINTMLIKTLALVKKGTGLPLYAHNTHDIRTAPGQIGTLEKNGADLGKVIIGHCSDTVDAGYLESILRNGCYLGFDRIRPNPDNNEAQVRTLCGLIAQGWIDKLLLSHDYCTFIDFGNNAPGNAVPKDFNGYGYLHDVFLPLLRKHGVTEKQLNRITTENPSRLFQ